MHTINCVPHLNDELHDFYAGGINNHLKIWYCILCTDHLKGKQQKCNCRTERTISIKQIQYVWNSYLS